MRLFTKLGALALVLLVAGCSKKHEDAPTSKDAAPLTPLTKAPSPGKTGDGGAMASPLGLAMGKAVEGTLGCGGPMWLVLVPGPLEGQVKYELKIPKGADQYCTHLNARGATGHVLDSTLSLCSDDPTKYAAGKAPFGKDVAFFTIDPNDPNAPCVRAQYRVSLAAN